MGKCSLRVEVPETGEKCISDFIIVPGEEPSLLGRPTSETLDVLRISVPIRGHTRPRKHAISL